MNPLTLNPQGRRLRFSLRALLVLIAIAAAGVGLVERRVADLRIQRSVAAEVQRLGGYLRWDSHPMGPRWLTRLLADDFFDFVSMVECDNPQLGDDTLMHLEKLHRTQWLMLDSDRITDQGVARIANLPALVRLDLGSRRITDAGLGQLARLSNLRWLALRRTQATLAGLERLRRALPACEIKWEPGSEPNSTAPPADNGPADQVASLAENLPRL